MKIEKGKLCLYDGELYKSVDGDCGFINNKGESFCIFGTKEGILSDKIAVHCPTKEDCDYVTKILKYTWNDGTWRIYEDETCVSLNNSRFSDIGFYIENDYHIISIDQFKQFYLEEECTVINAITDKSDDNVQNNRHKCLEKTKEMLDNLPNDLTAKFGTGGDMMLTLERGKKESSNKLEYELDFDFIKQMAERMQSNKGKYEPYNWKKSMDVDKLKQALFRHVIEVMKGNYKDEGRLHGHLEAISCNAMMINYQLNTRDK